jgi:hypothetical protein
MDENLMGSSCGEVVDDGVDDDAFVSIVCAETAVHAPARRRVAAWICAYA